MSTESNIPYEYMYCPFLSGAREFFENEFDTEDMLQPDVRGRAFTRVGRPFNPDVETTPETILGTREDAETEILSYPLSRIYVSLIGDSRIIQKYAEHETTAAIYHLNKHIGDNISVDMLADEYDINLTKKNRTDLFQHHPVFENWEEFTAENRQTVMKTLSDKSLPFTVEDYKQANAEDAIFELTDSVSEKDVYIIPITEYLDTASELEGSIWELGNRVILDNQVVLSQSELLEFFEELIYNDIKGDLPLTVPDEIKEIVETEVTNLQKQIPPEAYSSDIDYIEEGIFPPVIDRLLHDAREGVNQEHMERFTLCAFLINIGADVDDVVEMIGSHWDNQVARKQVSHIATAGGEGEGYVCPTYSRIEGYGVNWEKDALEESVKHPLTYYRIKLDEEGVDMSEALKNELDDENE